MKKKIAIIGAGPAGLACAYKLKDHPDLKVDLFEKSNEVGGMAKSIHLWGRKVDLGPHRFYTKYRDVENLWNQVLGNDQVIIHRQTRVYYNKRFFKYPLEPFNALINLGILQSLNVLLSYLKIKIFPPKNINTFENWVTYYFGKKLYQIFFKEYTYKLWGIEGDKLDAKFAVQRIKKFSLAQAIVAAFKLSKNKHRSITDSFSYPIDNNGTFYEKLKKSCVDSQVTFYFKVNIEDLKGNSDNAELKINGEWKKYDYIVSTMPVTILYDFLANNTEKINLPLQHLNFRNTILVYVEINHHDIFRDQWIYINDSDLRTGRITNFSNWTSEESIRKNTTILCLEYWCNSDDFLWNSHEEHIIEIAKIDLKKWPMTQYSHYLNFSVLKIDKSYPIYGPGHDDDLKKLIKFLDQYPHIIPIGRGGAFKYNNQDHSLLMGIKAAERIIKKSNCSLWSINADNEYGEELKKDY